LLRLFGDVEVAGYEVGDPGHVVVVGSDDLGERDLVPGHGTLDDRP
jgi:hypothetical protein